MTALQRLQDRLRLLYPITTFHSKTYMLTWLPESAAEWLMREGFIVSPLVTTFQPSPDSAPLSLVTVPAPRAAYFGLALQEGHWTLRSWLVLGGGVLVTEKRETTTALFGVRWSRELYALLPALSPSALPCDEDVSDPLHGLAGLQRECPYRWPALVSQCVPHATWRGLCRLWKAKARQWLPI